MTTSTPSTSGPGAAYSVADLESRLRPSERMPVLFVGHGNPMHAIRESDYTRTWEHEGRRLPQAQAIVVISAHWLTPGRTHITDAPRNRVIYDFGGFPDELYRVRYDSVGDHAVAQVLAHQLVEYEAALDAQWGLDHGTWSILKYLAPEPQVPVLQISIDDTLPLPRLHDLYARLRRLRHQGVLFIGSGVPLPSWLTGTVTSTRLTSELLPSMVPLPTCKKTRRGADAIERDQAWASIANSTAVSAVLSTRP